MESLLSANQPMVRFVYGLAIFLMGWTIWVLPRKPSGLWLARSLPYLAAYGILRGLSEWSLVFIQLQREHLDPATLLFIRRTAEVLMSLPFLCLYLFGADLVRRLGRWWNLVPYMGLLFFGAWVAAFVYLSGGPLPLEQQEAILIASEVWARYLLVVPGTLLAAAGLFVQTRQFKVGGFQSLLPDLRGAIVCMLLYCVLAGILVPKAPIFPASLIHLDMFPHMDSLVILLRRVCSLGLAFFLMRTLRVFDSETERRLEIAEAARAAAEEREQLGLQLHDGILQSVYATGLGLQAVRRRMLTDPEGAAQRVDLTLERLNGVIDEIRAYIRTLTTAPVSMEELQRAISGVLEEFETLYGIPCTLTTDPAVSTSTAMMSTQHIIPILHESLSNAGRHSGASLVKVRLGIEENMVTLTICDNGKGFDPQAAMARPGHYGLHNLQHRAHTAGGSLSVRSGAEKGTVVEMRLPIQQGGS